MSIVQWCRNKFDSRESNDFEDWSVNPPPKSTVNGNLHEEFAAILPKLLYLAHPDKHNNSNLSLEVTKWLNQQKTIVKRRK